MGLIDKDFFFKILVDMKVLISIFALLNELDFTTVSYGEIRSVESTIRFCSTLYQ